MHAGASWPHWTHCSRGGRGLALRRWPAVLCLAAIDTAAVDAQREDLLGLALSQVVLRGLNAAEPAAIGLSPNAAIDADIARQWLGRGRADTPVDDMIGERMNDWLAPDLVESVAQVTDSYDRYQFLAGLVYFDETTRRDRSGWAPVGSFGWRRRYGWTLPDAIAAELEQRGARWPLLSAGLFGFGAGRAKAAPNGWREHVQQVSSQRLCPMARVTWACACSRPGIRDHLTSQPDARLTPRNRRFAGGT